MSDDTKHKIKLSELEMRMVKESVEATAYLGIYSGTVFKIRKKMTIKEIAPDETPPQK